MKNPKISDSERGVSLKYIQNRLSADSYKRKSLIGAEAYLLCMKKVMDHNSKGKTKDGQRPLREKRKNIHVIRYENSNIFNSIIRDVSQSCQ